MDTLYEPRLGGLIEAALARLQLEMERAAPVMADEAFAWMGRLAGGATPADYFRHPSAFPALLLPWWLEGTLRPAPDLSFQAELVYSTINGYYYIRLLDNIMDGQDTGESKLLPVAGFFHTQFQAAYHRLFAPDHPFWAHFERVWFGAAEATLRDARFPDLDAPRFRQVASRKVSPVKIPVAATCFSSERPDRIEPWWRFCVALGAWHQMGNDLFGWPRDLALGLPTFFLSEAKRRKRPGEGVEAWVAREGFAWGVRTLRGWMAVLRKHAGPLGSPDLEAYLGRREEALRRRCEDAAQGLRQLALLGGSLGAGPGSGP